jgi:polyisoprenoid-binding protein YceI
MIYQIDPQHSGASFKVRHMMIANVKGEFTKVSGTVNFDPNNPTASSVEANIDAASISTREPQRDEHLKSADFLDATKYPELTFRSTSITPDGNGGYKINGDLTIHGVTKPVSLEVDSFSDEIKDPWGFMRRGASASTRINRKDFGLTWNALTETGGIMVGDQIDITLDVEMARKPE